MSLTVGSIVIRVTDLDYVIMEDPEGNRFCVVDAHGDDSASDAVGE